MVRVMPIKELMGEIIKGIISLVLYGFSILP